MANRRGNNNHPHKDAEAAKVNLLRQSVRHKTQEGQRSVEAPCQLDLTHDLRRPTLADESPALSGERVEA